MHRNQLVAEAIKNGADPILVKCALEGDYGNNQLCMTRAMTLKQGNPSGDSSPNREIQKDKVETAPQK